MTGAYTVTLSETALCRLLDRVVVLESRVDAVQTILRGMLDEADYVALVRPDIPLAQWMHTQAQKALDTLGESATLSANLGREEKMDDVLYAATEPAPEPEPEPAPEPAPTE